MESIINFSNNNSFESSSQLLRRLDKEEYNLKSHLSSIIHDSVWVEKIRTYFKPLPLIGNLRCGRWYSGTFDNLCYFKSSDGHYGNWRFSKTRLNLHLLDIIIQQLNNNNNNNSNNNDLSMVGCLILDSTRKGKKYPDSFSRTIPIWCCVINRTLFKLKQQQQQQQQKTIEEINNVNEWQELKLPLWIAQSELDQINRLVDEYSMELLKISNVLGLDSYAINIHKPIKPLWINVETTLWEEQLDQNDLSFYPLYLLSCSEHREENIPFRAYIQGAADDEENWANGLTPTLFWRKKDEIMSHDLKDFDEFIAKLVEIDKSMVSSSIFTNNNNLLFINNGYIQILNTNLYVSISNDLNIILFKEFNHFINCSQYSYNIKEMVSNDDTTILNQYHHIPIKEGKISKSDIYIRLKEIEETFVNINSGNQQQLDQKILIHSILGYTNCIIVLVTIISLYYTVSTQNMDGIQTSTLTINRDLKRNKLIQKQQVNSLYLMIEKYIPVKQSFPHKTIRNCINNYLMSIIK